MKRIVQVCAVDFTAYHLLRPLLVACDAAGWITEFACADGPLAAKLRAEGFRHRRVPMTRSVSPQLAVAVASLARSLGNERPDVVHTHTPAGGIVGRAAAALAGVPTIVHTFHGLPLLGAGPTVMERAFLAVERQLARRTDLFLSQAAGDMDRAVALGIARRIDSVVIGNGVDLVRFAPAGADRERGRAELDVPADAVVAVYVGRLVREKGLVELADAALALRDLTHLWFLVVGAALASDRTDVTAALDVHPVRQALGARWRRLGYREDIAALLRMADLFVLPTYREGMPRSVIEAMAAGLPVIASDIAACRELVDDGSTGILVPPRDAVALAVALRALADDPPRRAAMGARARARALARHDERAIVARQVELLERAVRARGRGAPEP